MLTEYKAPSYLEDGFNCPNCHVWVHQRWFDHVSAHNTATGGAGHLADLAASLCDRCKQWAIWRNEKLIDPDTGGAAPANPDMPADVRSDRDEAASILSRSPRGAAALLRLALQKLCSHLGEQGHSIDDDIGSLVSKGMRQEIQEALDAVRVIGNNAVHPGQLDISDDQDTAAALFDLINVIVDDRISQPKAIKTIYSKLPASAVAAIQKRDAKP